MAVLGNNLKLSIPRKYIIFQTTYLTFFAANELYYTSIYVRTYVKRNYVKRLWLYEITVIIVHVSIWKFSLHLYSLAYKVIDVHPHVQKRTLFQMRTIPTVLKISSEICASISRQLLLSSLRRGLGLQKYCCSVKCLERKWNENA